MTKKCLIIDDVEVSRYVLTVNMMDLGFEVIEAEDADKALELMQNNKFEVAIVDWHLRQESGLDLVPQLRKTKGHENIPVLVCSGVERGDVTASVNESGAQAFLKKPVSREQLETELRKIRVL